MSVDNWGLIPSGSPGRWCRTHFGAAPPGRARKLGYLFTDFSSSVKICFQEHYLLQQRHAAEPWRSTLQFSQGSLQKTLHGIQLQLTPPAPRNLLVIGPGSKATETALRTCWRSALALAPLIMCGLQSHLIHGLEQYSQTWCMLSLQSEEAYPYCTPTWYKEQDAGTCPQGWSGPRQLNLKNFTDVAGPPVILGLISSLLVFKWLTRCYQNRGTWDFPAGPVVKNPPANAGDTGSIPDLGTRIPHAMGQLSLQAKTTEACAP